MQETWITVKEVSKSLNLTESAIKKSIHKYQYKYIDGIGRGGQQILISLESLPPEAQARYYNEHKEIEAPALDLIDFESKYTKKQKDEANFKAHVLYCFWRSGKSAKNFLDKFNEEQGERITLRQLYDWQRKFKESSQNPESLIDLRGGWNKGNCSISDEAWEMFYSLYMTLQRRSIKLCYDKVKLKYPNVPGISAFEKKVSEIPQYVILKYRIGTKAFNDSLPSMIRDKSNVMSNDIWCSDHHRADVFVKNSVGHIIRPWITVFTDIRSTKVISYIVREDDPNTTVVKKCLRLGLEHHGVPKEIYTDNGKDYKEKSLSPEYPLSILNALGIGKITATPYHGQAKPVERFFRTLEERFGKIFYSYAGNDAKKRPEHMQKTSKALEKDENIPTEAFYKEQFEKYIEEYNNTPVYNESMDGKTPNEEYYQNLILKREVTNKDALRLLCGKTVERTVIKGEIRIYNNSFNNKENGLFAYENKKVSVTYDPDDMEKLYVFDLNYTYICSIESKFKTPFRGCTEADYIRAQKEKSLIRKAVRENKPKREADTFELISRYQMQEYMYQENQVENIEDVSTPYSEQAQKAIENKPTRKPRQIWVDMNKKFEEENKEVI